MRPRTPRTRLAAVPSAAETWLQMADERFPHESDGAPVDSKPSPLPVTWCEPTSGCIRPCNAVACRARVQGCVPNWQASTTSPLCAPPYYVLAGFCVFRRNGSQQVSRSLDARTDQKRWTMRLGGGRDHGLTKWRNETMLSGHMPAQDDEPPCVAPGPDSQPIPSNASCVS